MKTMSCAFVAAALAVGLVTVSFAEEDFSTAVEATPRLGVGNFLAKARAGQPVTVAYFGGSITAQGSDVTKKGGWRVKTTQWLREKFPQTRVTEVNAAIGGTGSGLGVYRYGHDVLVHNPDLVFVEFACNDGGDGCNVKETLRNFEGIVRQTWKKNPRTDIVFAYTITEAMRERYLTGKRPCAAQTDERVAANYGIPTVDFGPRVAKLVAENKLIIDPKAVMPTAVPKGDPKFDQALREAMKNEKRILFANDGVHPRDEGHDLYLASVQALFAAMEDLPAVDHAPALAKLMTADNRENAKMVPISSAITVGDSCRALDAKDGLQRSFGHRAGQLWRISKPGDGIRFKFRGTSCQIYDLLGPNCGQVWITVDGKRCARPVPRFDSYCTYHRLASLSVYEGADGEHSVEITVDANQPDRRSVAFRLKNPEKELASPKYNGTDWYLGQVMLVGEMVEGPVALWPSPLTEMRAQPSSKIAMLPDGAVAVTTGTKYEWPGVRMDFVNGPFDLSSYGKIQIKLSNTTDRAVQVCLSVKSQALQGQSPGGNVTLPPHATGAIAADLQMIPWQLDRPLDFVGMRGYPTASAVGSKLFDIRRTISFHIFRGGTSEPAGFAVYGVTVGGSSRPVKLLKADSFMPYVDAYGQFKHDDWPGKIHSQAELEQSREEERVWLDRHATSPIPEADRFGGWAAGPQLKATGFFRVEKVRGKWWLVDPDGRLFFSHGVDCVNHGEGVTGVQYREHYFENLPPKSDPQFGRFWGVCNWKAAHGFYSESNHYPYAIYNVGAANMLRKYGSDWQAIARDMAHRRIRAWGLNTIANWSQSDIYGMDRTPYTLCLGTGGTPRLKGSKGWWGALPDPFTDEFAKTFRQRARAAAKSMKNDPWCVGVFVDNELSWNHEPRMAEVADKYFSVISGILREELPNHLYLGCRIAWGTDVIYKAAAKYCDVVSVNIYNRVPNRDLPAGAVDRPMINGEFHFGALDRGMFHTGLVATENQVERAKCYRNFVNACLDHPRFVGTHWFQWKDQPLTGRSDGENYQIGFLTITDRPYPELVEAAREVAAGMYRRRYGQD